MYWLWLVGGVVVVVYGVVYMEFECLFWLVVVE